MFAIVRMARDAIEDLQMPRDDWGLKHSLQALRIGCYVHDGQAFAAIVSSPTGGAQAIVAAERDAIEKLSKRNLGRLEKHQRAAFGMLLTLGIHTHDICKDLVEKDVRGYDSFEFTIQLRIELEDANASESLGRLLILNGGFRFPYGSEYLGSGAAGALAITPLTDRAYRAILSAYGMHFGAAPVGPAGTGKTETVKDLAKNCGYGCVVFNCSDQLDYIVMGKFLKGLVGTGFWGCFDEFNRVNVEVMSVVEAVVKSILRRLEQLAGAVGPMIIIDSEIFAQPTMHMCITMNPGYAGRSKLPESLEILFRSVTMLVPDITFIVEIQLACEGILNSRSLAKKLAMLCRCCESLLSKQPHYDYGLRFVKSCIKTIGSAKRAQGIPLQEYAPAVKTHEKVELLKRCHVLVLNRSF